LGCPLKADKDMSDRPFVDWRVIDKWLAHIGYYHTIESGIFRDLGYTDEEIKRMGIE
jgi:hypothetical protein